MESATARGVGKSLNGVKLESVTIEAILPSSVAAIIEFQTDNRLRTLADVRLIVKDFGGTVSPTNHLFERRGRIIFKKTGTVDEEVVFDHVIEAGALDVEIEDNGQIVVYTEPQRTSSTAEALASTAGLQHERSDVIWYPNTETLVHNVSPDTVADFVGKTHSFNS